MKLRFRFGTEADRPSLQRLWSEHGGWGDVDGEFWENSMLRSPAGEARIVVATDPATDELLGQLAFVPVRVSVGGRELTAFRPYAPILAGAARGTFRVPNPLKHPIVLMYKHGVHALREEGSGLQVGIVSSRWKSFGLRIPGLRGSAFPFWSLPLEAAEALAPPTWCAAGRLEAFDGAVDRLWRRVGPLHECLMVRDSAALAWRYGQGFLATSVEREGELVGLAFGRPRGPQWQLIDIIAEDLDRALEATLRAACAAAYEFRDDPRLKRPLEKIGVLAAPAIRPALARLGFRPEEYEYVFLVRLLRPSIDPSHVAPEKWYLGSLD